MMLQDLIPFSATLNPPEVSSDRERGEAEGQMGARALALYNVLVRHNIKHEYYVGGYAGHDWEAWRRSLYYWVLPNLWRSK